MWYTTRQEGFDDPRPTKRGPCVDFSSLPAMQMLLRMGFTVQFFSLSALYITFWAFGGFGLFGYDLSGTSEEGRQNQTFRTLLVVWSGLYMLGALYLLTFQAQMADDACWARGYRAGSKILRLAVFLDLVSSLLQFMFYLYIAKFYQAKWWGHFNNGGSEWTFFAYTRILHSMACILYGLACYLLEVYHDEGAGDLHAYLNGLLFCVAGAAEFLVIFIKYVSISTFFIWLALLAATLWSYFFEPEVNMTSPELYETELTNDVEHQVETFARCQ